MARTYVPTLLSLARRLDRYIERYDQVIGITLTGDRLAAFNIFRVALTAYINANTGFTS